MIEDIIIPISCDRCGRRISLIMDTYPFHSYGLWVKFLSQHRDTAGWNIDLENGSAICPECKKRS